MQIHILSTVIGGILRKAGPLHAKQLPIVHQWSVFCCPEFLGSHFTRNLLAVHSGSLWRALLLCNTFHVVLNALDAQ